VRVRGATRAPPNSSVARPNPWRAHLTLVVRPRAVRFQAVLRRPPCEFAGVRCRCRYLSFSALQIVEEAAAPPRVPRRTTFWRTKVASPDKGSVSALAVGLRLGRCCPFLTAAAEWSASTADAVLATSREFEFDRRRT
jgi:hypothetical protein